MKVVNLIVREHKTFKTAGSADVIFPKKIYDTVVEFKEIRLRIPGKNNGFLFAKWGPYNNEDLLAESSPRN